MSTKRDYTKLHLNDLLTLVQNGEKGANLEIKERFRDQEKLVKDLVDFYENDQELYEHIDKFLRERR